MYLSRPLVTANCDAIEMLSTRRDRRKAHAPRVAAMREKRLETERREREIAEKRALKISSRAI